MPPAPPRRVAVFLGALALDALLGDPPTALHPVGWLGRAVRAAEGAAPRTPRARRAFGVAAAVAFPALAGGLARLVTTRGAGGALAATLLLDAVFALRTLLARAEEVRVALEVGDLDGARALLARHLVSRVTADLSEAEVAGAAVESVAENLGDGVLGPWLAYAALGVPGAAAYRAVNTLDSMWGYRTDEYRDLGWASARLDDLVNLAPARLAAVAVAGAAWALHEDAPGAVEAWRRDAGATDSPNAGHPMAAMAGALGLRLTKRGAYALGDGRAPRAEDIARAVRLARAAALGTAAVLALVLVAEGEVVPVSVVHGGLDDGERAALPGGGAIVDLSANLHPDGPPPEVVAAIRAADVGRYPSVDAAPLRESLAALHGVGPESVVVTPGASAAIYLALGTLLAPGDRCAVFEPTFGEYAPAIEAAGGTVVSANAGEPRFDLAEPPEAECAVLCNPNNPTGRLVARRTVETLLRRVRALVIDAAYEALGEGVWDAAGLVRAGAPVVVVHSLTKLFAMPGVRLGYLVAPPALAAALRAQQPPWPVGAAEIAAGLAAVAGIEARRASVPALHDRRRRIEAVLGEFGATCAPSVTNFALAEVGDAVRFRAALLGRGFAVRDATSFGLPTWVRIAVPAEAEMPRLLAALRETAREVRG